MLPIAPLTAALMMFAVSAHADDTNGSSLHAGIEETATRLALTSEQEEQVRSILEEHLQAQMATLDGYGIDDGDTADTVDLQQMRSLRTDLRANREKFEKRLSEALSETQSAELRHIFDEREERLNDMIMSKRLDMIGQRLELSSEQAGQVRPILTEHFEAQIAILDKHGVAAGNRDDGKRPRLRTLRRLRKDLGAVNDRTDERLAAILSSSQLEKYEELQAEQREKLRALLSER